jgi:hypothetical protein
VQLTADQQYTLLTEMATKAAAAGVPPAEIEAKLNQFRDRIQNGEDVFAPVFERAREISTARKSFNQPTPEWTPSLQQQMNSVRMSPNEMYREGFNRPEQPKEQGFLESFSNAGLNALSTAGRTLIGAGEGLATVSDPIRVANLLAGNTDPRTEEAFKTIDAARRAESRRTATGGGGIAGSVLGGIGTLGLGALSSGQDVIAEGGTLPQALGAQATDLAQLELGLLTGKLLPNASVAQRVLAQGAVGAGVGIGGRALRNEFVPEALRQDALDPVNIALDFGGSAVGGIVPDRPRTSITPRTGDSAVDAGISATESLLNDSPRTKPPERIDFGTVDPTKGFTQEFPAGKFDVSKNPREELDASDFINEPSRVAAAQRKQSQIEQAYEQLRRERLATVERAYAQRDVSDAALGQELPGINPVDPVRGASEQSVPRGTPLGLDQLSVLRDQLRQQNEVPTSTDVPSATSPGPQPFSTEFQPDPRNTLTPASTEITPLERPVPDVSYLNQAKRKISPSPDWKFNPMKPLAEQVPPETMAQVNEMTETQLADRIKSIENAKPFNGSSPTPIRLAGQLSNQMEQAFNKNATPRVIADLYDSGELRTGDVFGALLDDSEGLYKGQDQFKALMSHINSLGDRLGGLDTPIVRYDPSDASHASSYEAASRSSVLEGKEVGGWYDPATNVIYSNTARPNIPLLIHEATHAVTNRVLDMGEMGKLQGPARQAFDEFHALFDTLQPKLLEDAKGLDSKKYGLSNIHEYMSEFYSNPTFREHLKSLKITPEYASTLGLGRLAVAKVKNMYQATVQFVRNALGLPERAESALDLLFAAQQRFTDSIDEGTARTSRELNSKGTQSPVRAGLLPARASNLIRDAAQVAAVGVGRFPIVRQAAERAKGSKAAGVERATVLGNQFEKASGKLNEAQQKDVLANIDVAIKNSSKPEGLQALQAIEKTSPEIGQIVRYFADQRHTEAVNYAKNILADPNATSRTKAIAATVLDRADSYLYRAYAQNFIKDYGLNKLKLAQRAMDKQAKGQTLFNREKEALEQTNAAKVYLKEKFLPDDLNSLKTDQLEDLYKFYTNRNIQEVAPLESFGDTNPKELRKEFLKSEIRNAMGKIGNADEMVDQLMQAAAGVTKNPATARYFKNMREGTDVKSVLDDVPPELRKFWGEVENPIARMMTTIMNQSSINAQMNALLALRKEGLGTMFKEGPGHKGYDVVLEGEKMGPLQGLRTTPLGAAAVNSTVQSGNFLGSWAQNFMGDPTGQGALAKFGANAAGTVKAVTTTRKYMSVIGNLVGRSIINGIGSGMQAVSNGNVNPAHLLGGMRDMAGLINLSGKTEVNPQTQKYLRNGIAEASNLEDTFSLDSRKVLLDLIDQDAFMKPDTLPQKIQAAVTATGRKGRSALRLASEVYAGMDLWSKLANFRNEEAFWTEYNKKYGGISDVEKFVADRINNTNITPSRASPVAKLSDSVGASTFLPYSTEVMRTSYNNLEYGFKDLYEGLKLQRPELAIHGLKRIAGTGVAIGLGTQILASVLKGGAGLLGMTATMLEDDSERKKYLSSQDFTSGGTPLVIKDSEGKEYTLDAGMANPYDPAARPMLKLMDALSTQDEKQRDAKFKEAQRAFFGMLSQNGAWGMISKAVSGDPPSLAKSNPAHYQRRLEYAVNTLGLTKQQADRAMNIGAIGEPKANLEFQRGLDEQSDTNVRATIGSGVGLRPLDPVRDLKNYGGQRFVSELNAARKDYTDLLKVDFDVKPGRVEDEFREAIKDVAEPYTRLRLAVLAAKEQGKTIPEIVTALKLGRTPNKSIAAVLNGDDPPITLIASDLTQDIRADLMKDSTPEVEARARKNLGLLTKLLEKYQGVTASQLVNMENN